MASVPVMAGPRFPVWLMAALLALVTMALYWPATGHDFINYDDPTYVTDNLHVQAGLTWEGLAWAFGRVHGEETYWHPLTWVSHMLDCQWYGLQPWGHHLTSVLLHAANVVLVFLVFRRMTGAFWRCAVLAALFALHPLQVDAVAWVAERKTLLSAWFWLLALWAYARYVKCGVRSAECGVQNAESSHTHHAPRTTHHASRYYVLALFFFTLGLMCKPVLVTFPFVLLLLDSWPLCRLQLNTQHSTLKTLLPLLAEKLPFFALAAASSLLTLLAHRALGSLDWWPWDTRLANALVSYVRYLGKTFWPSRLSVFYPYPAAWPMWEVVACGLLLLIISGLVVGAARSRPWWWVGWFWFVGVLVPFSGLVQAGEQAMADRFMYVPVLGILLAVIWGLHGLARGGRYQPIALSVAGGVAMVLCLALTRQQLGYWKDSETLFRHALEVTENNYIAHYNLGNALNQKGQINEAIRQFQQALRLKPDAAEAHHNLGNALDENGQIDEALSQFQEALRLKPDAAEAHNNLGYALARKGQTDEAIRQYQQALRLKPDYALAHNNLGHALLRKGQTDEAITQYQQALRLKPDDALAHNNLGLALARQGQTDDAIRHYQEALRLKPDFSQPHLGLAQILPLAGRLQDAACHLEAFLRTCPRANLEAPNSPLREPALGALNNLAWFLATRPQAQDRDGVRAVRFAERACELTGRQIPVLVGTLAAAYAETGRYQEAVAAAQQARALAQAAGQPEVAEKNRQLLELYQSGQPYREPPPASGASQPAH